MAMRRSRGERSLTTRPPMRISPDVGASSPAIMRNNVVFPEPDGPGIIGSFLFQVRHGVRETGEVVELAGGKAVMEGIDVVDQELLGTVLVLGEVPDDIAIHDVLCSDAAHRAAQSPRDHDLALNRQVLALGLAS